MPCFTPISGHYEASECPLILSLVVRTAQLTTGLELSSGRSPENSSTLTRYLRRCGLLCRNVFVVISFGSPHFQGRANCGERSPKFLELQHRMLYCVVVQFSTAFRPRSGTTVLQISDSTPHSHRNKLDNASNLCPGASPAVATCTSDWFPKNFCSFTIEVAECSDWGFRAMESQSQG